MIDPASAERAPDALPIEFLAFEQLLAELSASFVNLPPAGVDAAITDALRRIAGALGADRCNLVRFVTGDAAHVTHTWSAPGAPAVRLRPIAGDFPWLLRCIRAGRPVVVGRLADLPPEAAVDEATWKRGGVKSNLTLPMTVGGRIEGAIAIASLQRERHWPEQIVSRLRVIADVFGNALAHKRAQEALDSAMAFERLVSEILAALLTATHADERDRIIDAGLGEMGQLLGAEGATLWARDGEKFRETHRWLGTDRWEPPDQAERSVLPWITAEVAGGAVVRFARLVDLPSAADADLPALRAIGVHSMMVVPLVVSGAVMRALCFATANRECDFPEELVPRVRLLGEVFASVLARAEAERREQDAQAQAAHAARVGTLGVVAASLVHELTQPLAASVANAETVARLLAAPSPDLDELRVVAADIVADERRLGELVQQLRRFLRRGEVQRTEVDVREVIADALQLAGKEATDSGIEIAVDFRQPLPALVADRVQLQQVLVNLVLNAIDAAAAVPAGSRRVAVLARASGTGVGIEVSDTGHGMDQATLARIFQPFFTTKPGGMGLGLSISRSIVAAHGGSLAVRSSPGQGTTFRIELPLRPTVEVPAASPARSPGAGAVYVVDDDPSLRRALERQLAGAGYRVETFASGEDYLAQAAAGGVGCIVSDLRMPGLSGLDLQAVLARSGCDLPMVFVSAHSDVPTTAQAMKAGAVSFLAKPFTQSELLAAVDDALARSRELDATRKERAALQARYETLTPRERQVLPLVAAGLLNKIIADRLGAAEQTVKIHRARVMEKMGAASLADLVRMSERLGSLANPGGARD